MNVRERLKQHIKDNRWQYGLIILIFCLGVILGNYKVLGLDGGVRSYLSDLIDNYLQGNSDLNGHGIFLKAFITQVKTVLLIWFLGLTVIGLPLILGAVFFRGFSLGFTVGFLMREKAGAGVLVTILSILPQNLVYVPFLVVWAVIAVNFSLYIVKGRNSGLPLGKGLIGYTLLMVIFILIFLLGSFIEAYLSPWFLRLVL